MQKRILVTGASGFVGGCVVNKLLASGLAVRALVRRSTPIPGAEVAIVDNIGLGVEYGLSLEGITDIVHLAARVHVMKEKVADSLAEFRKINLEGTLSLARQAAQAGVVRFIFMSSIKVNGETTQVDRPFFADDLAAPVDPYGTSKMEAEQCLRKIAEQTGMEVVIIRPPLIYGPGVKANFLSMMHWLRKGVTLPLGAIHNKRSFVALDNLVDLIVTCIDHPAAANQTFLVSDGEDISTTQLLQRMGGALGKPARLLPVPVWMLEAGAALLGKRDLSQRLCGNLQVDISKARDVLGWSPPVSVNEGLRVTAEHFLAGFSK